MNTHLEINIKKMKKVKIRKPKNQTLGNKIVTLLTQRNDVTRQMLPELLGCSQPTADNTVKNLRKLGFSIYPSKGPGTPLCIADTLTRKVKYLNWRSHLYLNTAKRMIVDEVEAGEQYRELADRPSKLLKELNETPNES